ncbi:integrase arm-type DNA-binding domain-containing protein [Cereibacter azotoformans]|uniref:Phage integrase family protein n=1 Tax=Cereibacter sphaeroides (strain ATCC 17025 / ATH 2.4.3) TaxID=349102 RepID=A4WNQ9_CERS5|nr:site-specific integrase [Cereibacter azotoformans]ULB08439.1 integrase arm-type DNA-binding domain-containing protein [Cereibacter azotoformans]
MKLTAVTVEKLQATDRRQEIPDSLCQGLYLVVQPTGKKGWQVRYRHAGVHRRMTLGGFPVLSLAQARQKAREALAAASEGRDPAEEVKAAKAPKPENDRDKVATVIDLFLKRHASRNRRADDVAAQFQREVLGKWGERDIRSITKRDVIDVLDGVVDRGSPISANRLRAHLNTLFNWAKSRDIIEVNPLDGVKPPAPEKPRDRVLTNEEIRLLWKVSGKMGYPFGDIYRLLLLTGQRLREVAELPWREIDGATWTLPGPRSKNGDEHVIPLSPEAREIIEAAPKVGRFVFSTTGLTPVSGFTRAKERLDGLMADAANEDLPAGAEPVTVPPFTIHDLRRTAATGMAGLRFPPHVVEAVLNHRSGTRRGVAGVYNRFDYADEKRQALETWARCVVALAEGGGKNVVPLRPAAGA